MPSPDEITVPTETGPGRLLVSRASSPAGSPWAVLWLGHGAGGGAGSRDLAALAAGLPRHGVTVVRHEQPWVVAGKRIAPRPAALDAAWLAAAPAVAELAGATPLVVGGRSAGARVACRTAGAVGAAAVLCLAFPLHPPGRPERSRSEELLTPRVPVLAVQGTRDPFGSAAELRAVAHGAPAVEVLPVEGADHGLRTARSAALGQEETLERVTAETLRFLRTAAAPG
ncbi:alpha/beta family hydrolase [Kocuria sp. SM24M-10]|uniref:alpha/beta hydrolase family protein n=1 Tax=Kocuria sp. SM24M-10 TaxID=1660349 RepID=UPI000AD02EA9|nr:alpha/beta family hydrolase [Kocuria sp. SM24M-10]